MLHTGYMFFSNPSSIRSSIEHLNRINIALRSSNMTNIFYESGLVFHKKNSISVTCSKLRAWMNYQVFCFALLIAPLFLVHKKYVPYQLSEINTIQKEALSRKSSWCSYLYTNTYSPNDLEVSFLRKYFENKKRILSDAASKERKRIFNPPFSPSFKDGIIIRVPELRLDAG